MEACRLLVDKAASGAWNMAVDEALARCISVAKVPALRVYRWEPATLSLGYFQAFEDRLVHRASQSCDVVRRTSGGGAILHDKEMTYCFAVPRTHRLAADPETLYRLVHGSLVAALATFHVEASLHSEMSSVENARVCDTQPAEFLCFERRASGDLVVGSAKVGGSAQRRLADAILQHGSLILSTSDFAPEIRGIAELTQSRFSFDELLAAWLPQLSAQLGVCWNQADLTDSEKQLAMTLRDTKFGQATWIQRK